MAKIYSGGINAPWSCCENSLFPASFASSSHLNLIMAFQSVRSCVQRASSTRHFCGMAPRALAQWSLIPPGAPSPGGLKKCPCRSGGGPPQRLSEHVWLWKIPTTPSLFSGNAQLTNAEVLIAMAPLIVLSHVLAFLFSSEHSYSCENEGWEFKKAISCATMPFLFFTSEPENRRHQATNTEEAKRRR